MRITPSSRAGRILQGLQSFHVRGTVPGDVPLEPSDTLLGVLAFEGRTSAVLLDSGVYLKVGDDWSFVPYTGIEAASPKDGLRPALLLATPLGSVEILAGSPDIEEIGRFFTVCAEDTSIA